MQTTLNEFVSPVKRVTQGKRLTLLPILALCLGVAVANAQTKPNAVVTQITNFGAIPNGGALAGGNSAGTSLGVNPNGDIIVDTTYGNELVLFNGQTGAQTVLGQFLATSGYANPGAVAADPQGNVFVGFEYGTQVMKVPYVGGQYAAISSTTAFPSNNCVGNDTTPCMMANLTQGNIISMVFDAKGDLFYASNDSTGTNPNAIWECTAACLYSSSPAPAMIYMEPTGSSGKQLEIGGMGVDPWGNLFFGDSLVVTSGSDENVSANLNELTTSTGAGYGGNTTGYAATTIVLYTLSDSSPGNYDDDLGSVAVDSNGTVYFGMLYDGVFAIPNNGGTISLTNNQPTQMYAVSFQGAKILGVDGKGNVYDISNNNLSGDDVMRIAIGNIAAPSSAVGTPATVSTSTAPDGVYATLNDGSSCSATLTVSAAEDGKGTSEFSGSGGTCKSLNTGVYFPVAFTFTPTSAGARNAIVTVNDGTGSGSAAASGIGQAEFANLDPGTPTVYTSGLSAPSSVVADAAGDVFVADPGNGTVYEFATGSNTGKIVGSGFSTPNAVTIDANGNLFIADNGVPDIVEIPNTGTTGAFTAGTQATVVSASTTIGGYGGPKLANPVGLAIGPNGVLYISDSGNKQVFTYNPATGTTGFTMATATNGLSAPAGVALDNSGNLYVADSALNKILTFSDANGMSTITPPNVTQAVAVAVDASGSVLVGDGQTGNIVWIPNQGGTLSTSNAITIESVSPQASSLWQDAMGDLYTASADGKAAYAIQRSQASVNFGTIVDGNNSSATVFFENTGNEATTLSASAISAPGNSLFSLVAPSTNPCSNSLSVSAGDYCETTAEFAPITGTAAGAIATSGAINYSPSNSETINLSGTAATSSLPTPTISFTPPNPVLIGQQVTLSSFASDSGSATSTSPITFTISPSSPCASCASLSGSTLTALSAGTVNITANQASNSSYSAAAPVTASITIQASTASDVPALLMSQQSWIKALPAGGAFAGQSAAGTSLGVNPAGNVVLSTSYGDTVAYINPQNPSASWTTLGNYGKYGNTGAVAVDSAGNLYVSALFSGIVVKLPYNKGAYSALTDATSGTEPEPGNCTGNDTAECVVAPISNIGGIGGISAMTLDAQGDLFLATDDQGNNPQSIWECTAACMASGTSGSPAPVMLFEEPAGSAPATAGQLYVGGLAVDPWGNLFFTDSNLVDEEVSSPSDESTYSDLYYLPTSASAGFNGATTGYAATPTLLQTLTDSSPGGYDDEIDGVAVTSTGTVYYAAQYDGVFAVPNTQSGGPDIAHQYVVSGQGAKEIALDQHGNIFYISYNSGDTLGQILTSSNLVTPIAQLNGPAVTASGTVVDNALSGCTPAATLSFTSTNPEFSATAGTPCSSVGANFKTSVNAAAYPATISFAATNGGPQTATLAVADTTNGGTGLATVTGVGQETPQTITFTAPTTTTYTYSSGLAIPFNVTGGGSNNPIIFNVDTSSTGAGTISGNTLTVTQAGNIVIDANQPGGLVNGVYYEAAPQAQFTLTIDKASQTISFAPPSSPVTFTPGLTVTLNATGGASGDTIVFSVDSSSTGNGTISGNTLTITQAGTITLDANQTGNVDYLAAAQAQQTLAVNQASQSITFVPITQQFHYVASGAALTVQATGGASDQPIVFAVDASSTMKGSFSASTVSGAMSTATLTLPAQTATSGTIVIDATQPGNANYAAATQVQETINVLAPLPTQTITFNNPGTQVAGTPLTLTATASSGFPVSYTATPSSVCTVAQSGTTWSATFVASGTCSITAAQPGDNQYYAAAPSVTQAFTVNPKGQVPSMALDFSSSTINVQPGTNALTQLTISSTNNFTGSVSFACSGLPTGYTCTFNPNPITVAAGGSATTTLTVASSSTAALHREPRPFYPVATVAVALCLLGFRRRNRLYMLLLLAVSVIGLGLVSGCGGSSTTTPASQTTSTNVTVTATSGSVQQTTTLTLLVQ